MFVLFVPSPIHDLGQTRIFAVAFQLRVGKGGCGFTSLLLAELRGGLYSHSLGWSIVSRAGVFGRKKVLGRCGRGLGGEGVAKEAAIVAGAFVEEEVMKVVVLDWCKSEYRAPRYNRAYCYSHVSKSSLP